MPSKNENNLPKRFDISLKESFNNSQTAELEKSYLQTSAEHPDLLKENQENQSTVSPIGTKTQELINWLRFNFKRALSDTKKVIERDELTPPTQSTVDKDVFKL